jgi:phosphatidylglycerophosphate synthase
MTGGDTTARRPLRSRQTRWASALAGWLTRRSVRPNQISLASVVFAALAGSCLGLSATTDPPLPSVLLVATAAFIQLRLLCNLLDGMVAVEGGLKTKSGEIFNDLPDRLSDTLILVSAGHSATWVSWGSTLGWAAAVAAILTAYVRVLGASAGAGHYFCGPMAKQHRMAVMTAACVAAALEAAADPGGRVMTVALLVIIVGCLVTIARRTRRIVADLESR